MEQFRHNLSPVEVKLFLKIIAGHSDILFIRYCLKVPAQCPECGHHEQCHSGAISLLSSNFDKLTHELNVCLQCGNVTILPLLTVEKL